MRSSWGAEAYSLICNQAPRVEGEVPGSECCRRRAVRPCVAVSHAADVRSAGVIDARLEASRSELPPH
jgi:hypothetical protein